MSSPKVAPSFYDDLWCSRGAEAHEIGHDIFLGSVNASSCEATLQRWNITHILVVHPSLPMHWPERHSYKRIPLEDVPTCNLLEILPDAFAFLAEAELQQGRVLVHCTRGISRSTSVVIGFLMLLQGLTYEDARTQVQQRRPVAYPNLGFQVQLQYLSSLVAKGCSAGPFRSKIEWLRGVVPTGNLSASVSAFKVRDAMSAPIRAQLEEVRALSSRALGCTRLAKQRDLWTRHGLFFEVLHKYRVVPSDRGLVDVASAVLRHMREEGSALGDGAVSLPGIRAAMAVSKEIETWIRLAMSVFRSCAQVSEQTAKVAKQVGDANGSASACTLVSYDSDSSSERAQDVKGKPKRRRIEP